MADRYFLNVGTNFNDTANWSTTSGGAAGASVPTSSDVVILDNNSGPLSLEININVKGISMAAGYASTFTQNAFTINYGSAFWEVAGGTFIGSGSAITGSSSSRFIMSGGTYTNTSGTHTVGVTGTGAYSINITGGVFNHNNGLMLLLGANHTWVRNLSAYPLYNFEFNLCTGCTLGGTGLYVANNVVGTLSNNSTATSLNIFVKGNVTFVNGATSLIFEGTGDQALNVTGTAILGSITINKPSGTLSINNDFAWSGHWTHTTGTINWNDKKATARFALGFTITSGQFHHLEQNSKSGVGIGTAGNPIQCEGDFILNGQTGVGNFPAVRFRGNLQILTANGTCSGVTFNGSTDQNVYAAVPGNTMDWIINKSAGKVILNADIEIMTSTRDLIINSGGFDQNGFNLIVPDLVSIASSVYDQGSGYLDCGRFTLLSGTYNEGEGGIICRGSTFSINPAAIFNRSLIGGGIFADSGVSTALALNTDGYTISNFSFGRLTQSLTLGSSVNINGYYKKSSTASTANVIGAGLLVRIGGNIEQNGIYSSRVLATSPTFVINGLVDQDIYSADGLLDSGIWHLAKPSGKVKQLSNITIDNGQAGDNGLNALICMFGVWCTNEFNLTVDGTITIVAGAELQKTPTSVITATISGTITNVNSCQKKTAFFLAV